MKTYSLILLFISTSFHLVRAQLEVIRDPIACAYGLKNVKTQKWIQEPKFQEIQKQPNGYYTTKIDEKWGALNKEGKVFLKNEYDVVYAMYSGLFVVGKNSKEEGLIFKKMGVMDTNKVWKVPMEYSSIEPAHDSRFHVSMTQVDKKGQMKYKSSICDEKGQLIFPLVDGLIIYQFYAKPVYLVGDAKRGTTTVVQNVRLINNLGQPISNEIYDAGGLCGENFVLVKEGKFGLSDFQGKTIVPPSYALYYPYMDNSGSLPCLHSHHQAFYRDNGKTGVVNGKWKILIPAIYDDLVQTNSNSHLHSKGRYIGLRKDKKKYDLINEHGQVIFEADTFLLKMFELPKTNIYEYTTHKVFYFFGVREEKGFKWGILDHNAKKLEEATNENIVLPNSKIALLIEHGTSGSAPNVKGISLLSENQSEAKNVEFIIQMDSIYLFKEGEDYYPLLFLQSKSAWSAHIYGYSNAKNHGNYVLIPGNSGSFIYNKKTKDFEKIKHIDLHSAWWPILHTNEGCNLIHPQKGKIFSEEMSVINCQYRLNNRIWAQHKTSKWKIYDTLGTLRVDAEFDAISYSGDSMIVKQNGFYGVLDVNFKWIIDPIYPDIMPLTRNLYLAVNQNKEAVVYDLSKGKKIDAGYKNFIPIVLFNDGKGAFFCMEKEGKSVCFNQNLTPSALSKYDLITQYWTEGASFLPFRLEASHLNKPYLAKHKKLIYDFFEPYYKQSITNNARFVLNGTRGSSHYNNNLFKVEYASSKALSLSLNRYENRTMDGHFVQENPGNFRQTCNWIFVDGKPKIIQFEDLFNPLNAAYQKELVASIQSQKTDGTECFDPKCLETKAEFFTFHEEGIMLHFMSLHSQELSVLLTKEQLENMHSARWILAYLR